MGIKTDCNGYCAPCSRRSDKDYFLHNNLLPIWYEDGVPQYHIPEVLSRLSHAEKMLIQRVSPFIPLHHLKCGIFGLCGHVCAFEQDINGVANVLPLLPHDVRLVKVVQILKAEIGSDAAIKKAFRVRRQYVLEALVWLRKYNTEYSDAAIDESRLDWINGDEGELTGQEIIVNDMVTNKDDSAENADLGPAPLQCVDPRLACEDTQAFGYMEEGGQAILSEEDTIINNALQESISASSKKSDVTIDWPARSQHAVSEYDDVKIFARSFPWLFPGGIGDIKDYPKPDQVMGEWGRRLLYYEDARFASDKIFVFFAMNYIVRHRNSNSGRFFIDKFQRNVPDTLEDLQESIRNGDTSFVNGITYWNQRIKGSSPYWHNKRAELYTWINQHMELGHGPPTFFITLSCAEYFWPDIIDLLRDRLQLAGLDASNCYVGSPHLVQLVNDYTLVIQEYFQQRTVAWLESVGKEILDIKYYWVRYEFAPGRGQIHAHLLAIPNNHDIYKAIHQACETPEEKANLLADWANESFGLTATVDPDYDIINANNTDNPVTVRFSDIIDQNGDTDDLVRVDGQRLLHMCETHQCSGFCMRQGNENRYVHHIVTTTLIIVYTHTAYYQQTTALQGRGRRRSNRG